MKKSKTSTSTQPKTDTHWSDPETEMDDMFPDSNEAARSIGQAEKEQRKIDKEKAKRLAEQARINSSD